MPTARATHGRRRAPRARHAARRSGVRRALTALTVVVSLLALTGTATAVVAYYKLNGNITKDDVARLIGPGRPDKIQNPDTKKEAENILLIGSDKRSGAAAKNPNVAGQRSDTTILLHLAADRKSAVLVSIPRDTIVDIPSCKRPDGTDVPAQSATMFNSAFSEAGAACTIKTVEHITNVRIDHHVVIDFGGFKDMVNALGGVRICLPKDVNDPESHLNLTKGYHTVRGSEALAYVRTRHALGNGGDLSRIERQQAFLGSLVSKVKNKGLLLRPDRLLGFLDAATKSITTDPGLGSLNALRQLAQDVKNIDTRNVTFLTAPNEPYPANPNRVQLKPSAASVWHALRYDQPLPGQGPKKATATPTSTAATLKTPPERISVRVLNGTYKAGEATRVAGELEAQGFKVVGVGNAPRRDHTTTTVLHDPGYDESGRTLGAALPGSTVQSDPSLSSVLVVVVGTDAPAVVTVNVAGSTASPPAEEKLATRSANDDICAA